LSKKYEANHFLNKFSDRRRSFGG